MLPMTLFPEPRKSKSTEKKEFPFLDMELYWREDSLKFQVHLKENQLLKYLNFGSAHTFACLRSIPSGVLRRLALLTSITPETRDKKMDELYPLHIAALRKAKLIKKDHHFLTLKEQFALIKSPTQNSQEPTEE